jgi:signal transduction histidine kinase
MEAIGVALDVTNRKTTEEALRTVSGRLIQAQEEERVRIARELHDDIGQRIALLAVELKRLKENPELSGEQLQQDIEYLAQLAAATASSVQVLSRTLHSSKLEILGISAAMKSLCAEFGRQNRTPIEFVSDVAYSLPQNISLCLYRVLQEGLHNAVKYSGAQQIFVRLHADADSVELTIRDSGTGFDLETVAVGGGLGLISMQERVHLVNGTIAIESAPGRGTTIRATIPFEESNAVRCA